MLELLIVMVIIGIIIAFILVAAFDGLRRAEERATQALISKLDAGLNDRLDSLTTLREREYAFLADESFPAVLASHGVALA